MKIYKSLIVLTLVFAAIVSAACSSSPAAQPTQPPAAATSGTSLDGRTLTAERCVGCHSLAKAESERGSTTQWQRVVQDMVRRGAQLTAEEQAAVVAYLAENYPG
jgi:hypothetical protein